VIHLHLLFGSETRKKCQRNQKPAGLWLVVLCDAYQDISPVLRRLDGDIISTSRFGVFRLFGLFGNDGSVKTLIDLTSATKQLVGSLVDAMNQ